ncbi:MAG: ABC transporter substrate-binding protein, partial [Desulfocurvibacter africanus]
SRPDQRMFGLATSPRKAGLTLGALSKNSVGISRATIMELLLQRMEAAYAIPAGALVPLEVKKIPIRMQMLLAGEIDLALLPEPLLSLAESKGGTVLATDQNLAMPLTVLCLADRLAADRATLDSFLAVYREALRRIAAEPEKYRGLMAETGRIPPELRDSFPMYRYPDPRLPTSQEIKDVQDWMLAKGLLAQPIQYARLVPAN